MARCNFVAGVDARRANGIDACLMRNDDEYFEMRLMLDENNGRSKYEYQMVSAGRVEIIITSVYLNYVARILGVFARLGIS